MLYAPGDTFTKLFPTRGTAGSANADGTPTAGLYRNGAVDGTVILTVANVATGLYRVTGTIPGAYAADDEVAVVGTATVGGTTDKIVIDLGRLVPVTDGFTSDDREALAQVKAQTDLITTGALQHFGAVSGTSLTLHQGDSYGTTSGEQLPFAKPSGASWPDLTDGWAVTFVARYASDDAADGTVVLSKVCTVTGASGFRLDLASSDTSGLAAGSGAWEWQAVAAKTGSLAKTLREGTMSVVERVTVA